MQSSLSVKTERGAYPITVLRGALAQIGEYLSLCRRVLIVTDEGVPAVYAKAVADACDAPLVVTLPQGEKSKSLSSFERLCRTMLDAGFTRHDCVVAVGGGMVGDLAGFAAASYMRGIDFYNIPTTLLSQVDSSIGGKVAVNLGEVKNCVGAFYPPRAVVIDPDVLKTLPERQISAGLAEALKMSLTHDPALFALFERGEARERLDEVILASLKIKKSVVEADEREAGLRRVLNFGHTVGHGIESVLGFDESRGRVQGLYHGECVALGMIPMCSEALRPRLICVLRTLSLPTECRVDTARVLAALAHDKKAKSDGIDCVLVDEVGSFRFEALTPAALKEKINESLMPE